MIHEIIIPLPIQVDALKYNMFFQAVFWLFVVKEMGARWQEEALEAGDPQPAQQPLPRYA